MRNEPNLKIEQYRRPDPLGRKQEHNKNYGYFDEVKRPTGLLRIISSGSATATEGLEAWEHVSVSLATRCPIWDEMNYVKRLFWNDDETVIQFHPKDAKYINFMPYCLHLWKKNGVDHELPPDDAV